jgi:N-acetylglucosaminyldiphosphoundecaprenol N-acetyl-beta-D-mannosaminyltransferase
LKSVKVLNCLVNKVTTKQTLQIIQESILKKEQLKHVVVNAGKLVSMQKDFSLYNSVTCSDLINADGQSVVWASKFLGDPLPERVAGIDLMESIVEMAYQNGFSCYFFGARDIVVKKVVEHYLTTFSSSIIAGYRNGYYSTEQEENIAELIADSRADILFVAISSPKKEIFLNKYKDKINAAFVMGVGGSFDVIAGITKRAPRWMQKVGLEWFYRFIQEPKRMWKRYLFGNTEFLWLVFKQRIGLYKNPWSNFNE